jgi:membrane complex biogenesis BtpA family protein
MIHLPPLPGAGNYEGSPVRTIAQRAVAEAQLLSEAGFDALLIQNTHDRPSTTYAPPETLTAMSAIAGAVAAAVSCPIGINVHKNDGPGALAVAHAVGATFVRVKVLVGATLGPEGIIQGNADAVVQLRNKLHSTIEIWADLGELTSVPLVNVSLAVLADWTARFGSADRLIVTEADVALSAVRVSAAREGASIPILIGGRTDPSSIAQAMAASDGVIVGSYLRADGKTANDLVAQRVHELVRAARPTS